MWGRGGGPFRRRTLSEETGIWYQANLGLALGAGAGFFVADAFDANPAWSVAAALGGAAIGQQVARNRQAGECAYCAGTNARGRARPSNRRLLNAEPRRPQWAMIPAVPGRSRRTGHSSWNIPPV